ncbi:hypothetical protein F2Q69_00006222 [Brassica cretica]|uniref:E2F/DP family winged-helix DNA-binding domain-containing protein n=1 Tax=Brassica cretica TaxID=69181 RepID=A0A8S9PA54_BRACR|nr:hypothetical protein F2Q69_00006222 [Brassica cretica]
MASSFTVLADLKAVCCLKTGRCSTSAEIRVERWRIYDVVNILESVGVLSRKGKSLYSWKGRTFERGFWHLEYLQQFPQVRISRYSHHSNMLTSQSFIIDGRKEHKVMYEERNGGANGE